MDKATTRYHILWNFHLKWHWIIDTGSLEYCLTESFQARCEWNQVILIQRAVFGRMELGRCVTRNFGHIGCKTDVLNQLDFACSGRQMCDFSVSDPTLVRTKPCPKDFTSYLDATYTCVPGKLNLHVYASYLGVTYKLISFVYNPLIHPLI